MLGRWNHRLSPRLHRAKQASPVHRRRSSTHVPGRLLRGDDLGPTRKEGHQTFRARTDEGAKALPLPPLLDPIVLQSRGRWEQPKDQPKFADFTPFQRRLWANTFAHALASPVRQCCHTNILLPKDLLMALHARPHPTTNDPWLLPVSLVSEEKRLGPPLYFVGHHTVATQLGKRKSLAKALPRHMTAKFSAPDLKNMVCREDMPDFILQTMRNKVFNKLSFNFSFRGRLIPVQSPRSEDIEHVDDISCVLFFGSLRTRADEFHQNLIDVQNELEKWVTYFIKNFSAKIDPHASADVTHSSPAWYTEPLVPRLQPRLKFPELEFHTTSWQGKKVALYSVTDLFGQEKTAELIKGSNSKYGDARCVVMKRARHNMPVEMLLMQLQAYIAQSAP
ncbi:hypothetical protein T440DRAFT_469378 [Plenodomus tracheiphilus IPT5]|uniref:Uncharacterized protein n=1 Tax=Plenodomus tracheiphilus IPT5 TaxID=1408161 RepID=A0A6A7B1W1_9PLEO|nr:hypothetical protein T440DRAFT_469378 [Plenodomus tracheiphilus IPT5]